MHVPKAVVVGLLLLGVSACSKEEMNQALEQAKAKTKSVTQQATEVVEAQLPETGEVTLEMASPIEPTRRASVELISFPDGRPSLVQIITYDLEGPTDTNYPKVLIQGPTDATDLPSLSGQSIECDLYVTLSGTGNMVMTEGDQPVKLSFATFNSQENTIAAKLGGVPMTNVEGETVNLRGGRVIAVAK